MTRQRTQPAAPWRSLDALASPEDPERLDLLGREFAPGASEPPSGPTRRTMLGLMGASMALAGLTSCRRPVEEIVPFVNAPELMVPGIPQQFATTLTRGTDALGVLVKAREGRPIKIEGNELHPTSGGAADAWAQASILALYDPDRSRRIHRAALKAGEGSGDNGGEAGGDGATDDITWEAFAAAWAAKAEAWASSGGSGLGILIEPYASPSIHERLQSLRRRYDNARIAVWSPVDDDRIFEGVRRATGRPGRPVLHLEKAKVVLALDADVLLTETGGVANTRGFAAARRQAAGHGGDPGKGHGGEPPRLYAVESTMSITGANADHRVRLTRREVPAFTAALALALWREGVAVELPADAAAPPLPDGVAEKVALLARELASAGTAALIAAGRSQPPEIHALVWRLNEALGAVGTTVTLGGLAHTGASSTDELTGLVQAMRAGEVATLVILGGNPVYDAPADLDFAGALESVAEVVHLSGYRDETSQHATWHLPRSHDLESWGDAVAPDGTLSVVQPLVAPLFDSRSVLQMLDLMTMDTTNAANAADATAPTGGEPPALDIVRSTWTRLLGSDGFEKRWRRVLYDGLARPELLARNGSEGGGAGTAPDRTNAVAGDVVGDVFTLARSRSSDGDTELTFHLSRAVHDGRFANLAWLQEMPDPITKITWDNAALVSPTTAETLGVSDGDVLRLTTDHGSIEIPVWRQPGQADGSIALTLGYGRNAVGRVGDGVGVDVYPVRTAQDPWAVPKVTAEIAGPHHELVQTQEHGSMEGRDLVRRASFEEYHADPEHAFHPPHHGPPLESLWEEPSYEDGYRWGMSIDLTACTGCNACVVACQSENNVPVVGREQVSKNREMHWLRVDRYFLGTEEDPAVVFQPVPCQHCENAPCEEVCPVAATVHDAEGLNLMVYNRCIGTRYCSNNCPYKVRRFNFFNYTRQTPELLKLAMNPDVTVRSRGVMEKCTYCLQRISAAKAEAKRDGHRKLEDGEIRTACQQTCPADAISFGDLNTEGSQVANAHQDHRSYTILAELNNKPRTAYLGRLHHPHPDWSAPSGEGEA